MTKVIVIIADTHTGGYTGVCSKNGIALDTGAVITPSKFQQFLIDSWEDFFYTFVPSVTTGIKSKILVHNGDAIDGVHHESAEVVPSVQSQEQAFVEMMKPIREQYDTYIQMRGTEVHGGIAEQSTERVAELLGSLKEKSTGRYSHLEKWIDCEGVILQLSHHIETTRSVAYETSAPMRELVTVWIENSQWGMKMPDIIVRSHRHRYTCVTLPTRGQDIACIVTPSWQLKTHYTYKIDRLRMPHIGGIVIICEDKKWTLEKKLYPLPFPKIETV
jgi:hypothetical protein